MRRRDFFGLLGTAPLLAAPSKLKLSVFTKHLQFLQGEALADAIANIGFDGADIALRKGGNIEPENAKAQFPALVKALRARNVEVPMITSGIVDADTPLAEPTIALLHDLGIKHYRWGGFRYDYTKPLQAQLDALKPRVEKLAALNRKYGVTAIYHTHSGLNQVGANIWDIYEVVRPFDPAEVAINYDIGHATVEGGFGGWINSFHVASKHIRGIALKDFVWTRDPKSNAPRPKWCPIGEGQVQFPLFFDMVSRSGFDGPLQVHYEYSLGGAESGKTAITIPQEQVFAAMKKDLAAIRNWMR